jgi:hypothetical protein
VFLLDRRHYSEQKESLRYLGEATRAHRDRAYTTEEIHKLVEGSDLRLSKTTVLAIKERRQRLWTFLLLSIRGDDK